MQPSEARTPGSFYRVSIELISCARPDLNRAGHKRIAGEVAQAVRAAAHTHAMPVESDPYADFDSAKAVWISAATSKRSGSWIEVTFVEGLIGLRNGADPDGPILVFTEAEWDDFVAGVLGGDYMFDSGDATRSSDMSERGRMVVNMLTESPADESQRKLVTAVSYAKAAVSYAKSAYYEAQQGETPGQTDE